MLPTLALTLIAPIPSLSGLPAYVIGHQTGPTETKWPAKAELLPGDLALAMTGQGTIKPAEAAGKAPSCMEAVQNQRGS